MEVDNMLKAALAFIGFDLLINHPFIFIGIIGIIGYGAYNYYKSQNEYPEEDENNFLSQIARKFLPDVKRYRFFSNRVDSKGNSVITYVDSQNVWADDKWGQCVYVLFYDVTYKNNEPEPKARTEVFENIVRLTLKDDEMLMMETGNFQTYYYPDLSAVDYRSFITKQKYENEGRNFQVIHSANVGKRDAAYNLLRDIIKMYAR